MTYRHRELREMFSDGVEMINIAQEHPKVAHMHNCGGRLVRMAYLTMALQCPEIAREYFQQARDCLKDSCSILFTLANKGDKRSIKVLQNQRERLGCVNSYAPR